MARDHGGHQSSGEQGEGDDVQPDHCVDPLPVTLLIEALDPRPRVVHQHVYRSKVLQQVSGERVDRAGVGEVAWVRTYDETGVFGRQLVFEPFKPLRPASDQHECTCPGCQLAS